MIHGVQPKLAEGGAIRIGELGKERKTRSGKMMRMPVKLSYFLITKPGRGPDGNLVHDTELMGALEGDGDGRLRELPIILHSDELEDVFPSNLALYAGRIMACRGDGKTATRYEVENKRKTGGSKEIPCPCGYLKNNTRDQLGITERLTKSQEAKIGTMVCRPHATFHCSIMAPGQAVAGAVHKWRTTSLISISAMRASLDHVRQAVGTIRGVPLWLRVKPVAVTPVDAPATTVYCCHLELRERDIQALQDRALRSAEVRHALQSDDPQEYRRLIAAPAVDETPAVEAEIQQEFAPERDWSGVGPEPWTEEESSA